jgi:hypothetical protein
VETGLSQSYKRPVPATTATAVDCCGLPPFLSLTSSSAAPRFPAAARSWVGESFPNPDAPVETTQQPRTNRSAHSCGRAMLGGHVEVPQDGHLYGQLSARCVVAPGFGSLWHQNATITSCWCFGRSSQHLDEQASMCRACPELPRGFGPRTRCNLFGAEAVLASAPCFMTQAQQPTVNCHTIGTVSLAVGSCAAACRCTGSPFTTAGKPATRSLRSAIPCGNGHWTLCPTGKVRLWFSVDNREIKYSIREGCAVTGHGSPGCPCNLDLTVLRTGAASRSQRVSRERPRKYLCDGADRPPQTSV